MSRHACKHGSFVACSRPIHLKAKSRDSCYAICAHSHAAHDGNCQAKLGLATWDEEAAALWTDLMELMDSSEPHTGVDFTIFFRALTDAALSEALVDETAVASKAATAKVAVGAETAAPLRIPSALYAAALDDITVWPADHTQGWEAWEAKYRARVATERVAPAMRHAQMSRANPRYVLRNWLAKGAIEAAEAGDFSPLRELHQVGCTNMCMQPVQSCVQAQAQ